jgi:hypothetical protein
MTRDENHERDAADVVAAVLGERKTALEAEGIRAEPAVERWSEGNAELRGSFWHDDQLVDVLEDFVVRGGTPVAEPDRIREWINSGGIDDVIQENAHRQ